VVRATGPASAKALVDSLHWELGERFPQAQIVVQTFGQGPPGSAPVAFSIYGEDPVRLREYGERLRRIMHALPEITHTRASIEGGEPKLWLRADEHQAQVAGLSLGAIASQFQASLEGATGGTVLEDLEVLPVRVRYGETERGSLDRIASLRLLAPARPGQWIPAEALGEVELRPELAGITRRNGERVNTVEGFIREGVLPIEVAAEVRRRVDAEGLGLAPGYRLEVAGNSAEQQDAVGKLLTYVPVLAVLMIAALVLAFRSATVAAIIGAVAVLSVGLGMLSLGLAGFPIGFNPIIGRAGLIGVAINGSIVVLAAIRSNPRARRAEPDAIVTEVMGLPAISWPPPSPPWPVSSRCCCSRGVTSGRPWRWSLPAGSGCPSPWG
jgi:multidrug efflux pump subunit AcrB